jgi:hypothetical protein
MIPGYFSQAPIDAVIYGDYTPEPNLCQAILSFVPEFCLKAIRALKYVVLPSAINVLRDE